MIPEVMGNMENTIFECLGIRDPIRHSSYPHRHILGFSNLQYNSGLLLSYANLEGGILVTQFNFVMPVQCNFRLITAVRSETPVAMNRLSMRPFMKWDDCPSKAPNKATANAAPVCLLAL